MASAQSFGAYGGYREKQGPTENNNACQHLEKWHLFLRRWTASARNSVAFVATATPKLH
jgi:hypothetical protein